MKRNRVAVTIPFTGSNKKDSTVANGNGLTAAGIYVPASLTGTALTFNAYTADDKFVGAISDAAGGYYTVTVASAKDQYVRLDKNMFQGVDKVQIHSGTDQATVDAVLQMIFE